MGNPVQLLKWMYNPAYMSRLAQARVFVWVSVLLIAVGVLRSSWATRLDGFTIDEPWHVTAGVAYLRTGEYYLNPEHPPLVKLVAALAAPRTIFRFTEPTRLQDKDNERKFVVATMYEQNDADSIQVRVRRVMYLFNGVLILFFAWAAFRVAGGFVAIGALAFVLVDPTVAAHWPVVMTDLPVALLSVTSVLLGVLIIREWSVVNLVLLAIALGMSLSAKHSGVITFGFVAALETGVLLWQFRRDRRMMVRRLVAFACVLASAVMILWATYGFHYRESKPGHGEFNRTLEAKIEDVQSAAWRFTLAKLALWHIVPRSYVWGFADIIRTGMEGRGNSTLAFGRLSFMEKRPLIFPGYIAVKLPIALTILSLFGGAIVFSRHSSRNDKQAAWVLLSLTAVLLLILARSSADYAGVRHVMTACLTMAVMAGFGVSFLLVRRKKLPGITVLGALFVACLPALAVQRPWEYHNVLGGGTTDAYRYFRNDGIDLGQRDKEIADYYHRKLEPAGEIPWVAYAGTLAKPDLIHYRKSRLRSLGDADTDEFPPATISGTLLVHGTVTAPMIWSDNEALRKARPVDRFGIVLVYRGTYFLPNMRADALIGRAGVLLEQDKPDFARIESLLREALALRSNDNTAWMMLGNLNLMHGEADKAVVAYRNARDATPPSPLRSQFDDQAQRVAAGSRKLMRDPGME